MPVDKCSWAILERQTTEGRYQAIAGRTELDFETGTDIWLTVESWAKETGYREKAKGDTWRRYQKGLGMPFIPKMVEIRQEGKKVQLQAWVGSVVGMGVGSGLWAMLPRKQARNDVNILLQRLGQPPLKI